VNAATVGATEQATVPRTTDVNLSDAWFPLDASVHHLVSVGTVGSSTVDPVEQIPDVEQTTASAKSSIVKIGDSSAIGGLDATRRAERLCNNIVDEFDVVQEALMKLLELEGFTGGCRSGR